MVSSKTMDTILIHVSLAIISTVARFSRPLAVSISMMAMDTLYTTVDITGSMAIAWLRRPLAIAIVAMKSLDSVVITSRMAIAITRFSLSRPLAISIPAIVSCKTMDTIFINISLAIISTIARFSRPLSVSMMAMDTLHPTINVTGSVAITRLSLSQHQHCGKGEGEAGDDGGHGDG